MSSQIASWRAAIPSIDNDTPDAWIDTFAFATRVGISPQAASKALRRSLEGNGWRDARLDVRRAPVRGGREGLGYQVRLDSLPLEFRAPASDAPNQPARSICSSSLRTRVTRLAAIESALREKPGSQARREQIESAASAAGQSVRTLYRWIKRYEARGIAGLARLTAPNANDRRVLVSRTFDRAFFESERPESELVIVARELDTAIKGLWASRAEQAGSNEIRQLAEFLLVELCEKRDLNLPAAACKLSRRRVERFAEFRVVNQRRNDRKAFDDAKPRIRRDWTGLLPMERVVADVKHLDIIVSRADGTKAWPKIVAFMDAGTGRVFVYPVLPAQGEGVRQEHVIEAFLAMVAEPSWGFPQGLYLDNGSEFGALAKIDSALRQLNDPGARTIIYARPYNASAKPIESLFARLDRYVFSLIPGYAGPNRMAAKTQTVGKPPAPYPGNWDEFQADVLQLIAAHNRRPVGGQWADRSPQDWLQDKAASGWAPATVEPQALDAAFSRTESRRIDRGVIKLGGVRYTHAKLSALPSRTVVDIALPWRRTAQPLARISGAWVYLREDTLLPARWIEGARESSGRQSAQARHVSQLAREVPEIDPVATKIRWARRQVEEETRIPSRRGPRLDLGGAVEQRAKDAAVDRPSSKAPPQDAERRRALEMAITERLEGQQNADR